MKKNMLSEVQQVLTEKFFNEKYSPHGKGEPGSVKQITLSNHE